MASCNTIKVFVPKHRETKWQNIQALWKLTSDSLAVKFDLNVVGHVNPDIPISQERERRREAVHNILTEKHGESCEIKEGNDANDLALISLKFDLMKTSVKTNLRMEVTSEQDALDKKAGIFLIYNYARIQSILSSFKENSTTGCRLGKYPHLPDICYINFSLLKEQSEWDLVFKYIYGFQKMIQLVQDCPSNHFKLISFLISLGRDFSTYYNRTHILTEFKEHLYPLMFARISLVMRIKTLIEYAFKLLDLPIVDCL